MRPKASSAARVIDATCASSVRSAGTASAAPPPASISAATASRSAGVRDTSTTDAPSRANVSAADPADAGSNPGHDRHLARQPCHGYRMRAPALASTIAPTRGFEASVARKKITLAISSASIIRFIGDFPAIR